MRILGYSERGVINALFYEIKYSQNNLLHLNDFLSMILFPCREVKFKLKDAEVLIEQSFSDFGDADLVLLLDNDGKKQAIFIEAKVKTCQKQYGIIKGEFKKMQEGIRQNKVSSSNLFIQIYYKFRLSQTLRCDDGLTQLKCGVEFPKWFSKNCRKIGSNKVVLKAVDLLAPYCEDVLFVALVPDLTEDLKKFNPKELSEWKVQNLGYLSWEKVEVFCRDRNFEGTLKIFKWNEGQIYEKE